MEKPFHVCHGQEALDIQVDHLEKSAEGPKAMALATLKGAEDTEARIMAKT